MQHVRTIDGVKTAAPGRWTIVGERSGVRFGHDHSAARILGGAGYASTHDDVRTAVVDVCYHGVYRHADRVSAWLTIRVEVPHTPDATPWGPCRSAVLVDADVHADPPATDSR